MQYLVAISLEIFLLCQVSVILALLVYKSRLDIFPSGHAIIDSEAALEELKPIVRANMYSALLMMPPMAVGVLASVVSILDHGLLVSVPVIALSLLVAVAGRWAKVSEERVRQIECSSDAIESEMVAIINCWLRKPLPNF